jgi:hypothetical protein
MPTFVKLRKRATGIIYKVNSFIVVKCLTIKGHKDFVKENQIFDILTQYSPCLELMASFLCFNNSNFLEYMSGFFFSERLQRYQIRDIKSTQVLLVQSLKLLLLRKT